MTYPFWLFSRGIFYIGLWVTLAACDDVPAPPRTASDELRALYIAAQHSPDAQYALALVYRRGTGVAVDNEIAFDWLRRSAQAGYAPAEYQLGSYYTLPEGGEDYATAAAWLQRAADQHYALAYLSLGQLYTLGFGVKRDLVSAYAWLSLAVDADVQDAKRARNVLMSHMTLEEFEQGHARYHQLMQESTVP